MRIYTPRQLTRTALIAAVYASVTLFLPIPAYGAIQLRPAEAMTVLPLLLPEAVPGLTLGCLLASLASPLPLDWLFGTLATLLAALWTQRIRNRRAAFVPPVVCNAVIVGAETAWVSSAGGGAFLPLLAFNAATIAVSELLACGILGMLLLRALEKHFKR